MMAYIEFSAIDFLLHEGRVLYNFQVRFGGRWCWVVSKTYEQFVELHVQLERHYGAINLPHLTGQVRPWARNTSSTATGRLPKLESYLNEALVSSPFWSPRLYDVELEDPDGGSVTVHLNKFLCAFLEVQEHTVSTSPTRSQAKTVTAPHAKAVWAPQTAAGTAATVEKVAGALASAPLTRTGQATASAAPQLTATESAAPQPQQQQSSPSSSAAAAEHPAPALEARLHSIMKRSSRDDSEELALVASASTITSQIIANVKDFSILERDHIDYFIHVSLCGHHWVMTKRYSEFRNLHNSLKAVYGEGTVPLLGHSMVPTWRKLTIETGEMRKKCFNQFLQEVVMSVDGWEPQGLLASFELSRHTVLGDTTRFTVYVNQILFDFLDFAPHIDALSGEAAAKAVVEQRATLPEAVKVAYDKRALEEKRLRMHESIARNERHLRPLQDDQLQVLLDRIALLDDDRDIIRMFKRLLATGEVATDVRSSFADVVADGSPEDGDGRGQEPQQEQRKEGGRDDMSAVVGLTARQLASITERLFFNDTKVESIRLFADVLINADDLQDVFDTLWFGWEEARAEVEQILTRR
ncbi:hypothetical protein DQ04_05851030 [Trypanosoma grayi]|uniref:hypothetical protein n=1 Tax=Trypanosoma grayi TaxID=71804 RepID=UPI0004F43AC7|nr:hypothetical protein DQ04_05851030 [Trypanosoma grayi]KEG09084.1 hypothetical protein DQ04_05851030 [Trypanosoma grayi]